MDSRTGTEPNITRSREQIQSVLALAEEASEHPQAGVWERAYGQAVSDFWRWVVGYTDERPALEASWRRG